MNPFEMVVAIIFLVTVGKVLKTHFQHRGAGAAEANDALQMRAEMQALRERVQVLERVVTDNHGSIDLDREIARLRDR